MDELLRSKPWFNIILKKPELHDITLRNLYFYYLSNDNIKKILPIITSNSHISIRLIDWFVTNYAKKNNTTYDLTDTYINNEKSFNVYLQYKCQLKSYKKKLFDPFCRKQRIVFCYEQNEGVATTIGQLNFFKWALMYGVIDYVEKNYRLITKDMITNNQLTKCSSSNTSQSNINMPLTEIHKTSNKIRKKRHELSSNANKSINVHCCRIVLSFE